METSQRTSSTITVGDGSAGVKRVPRPPCRTSGVRRVIACRGAPGRGGRAAGSHGSGPRTSPLLRVLPNVAKKNKSGWSGLSTLPPPDRQLPQQGVVAGPLRRAVEVRYDRLDENRAGR